MGLKYPKKEKEAKVQAKVQAAKAKAVHAGLVAPHSTTRMIALNHTGVKHTLWQIICQLERGRNLATSGRWHIFGKYRARLNRVYP